MGKEGGVKRDKFGATIRKRREGGVKEKSVKGGRWKILREKKRVYQWGLFLEFHTGERHRAR